MARVGALPSSNEMSRAAAMRPNVPGGTHGVLVHGSGDTGISRTIHRSPDTGGWPGASSWNCPREHRPGAIERKASLMRKRIALTALTAIAGLAGLGALA